MKRSVPFRLTLPFFALLVGLCVLPARSFADYLVADVSREQARDLGITVRTLPAADHDIRVQVEFKTAGRMKEFRWADLELTQGGKRLVTAPLQPRKPAQDSPADSKRLEFYIDPAALPNALVTIFVADEALGGTGYRVKIREFATKAASR